MHLYVHCHNKGDSMCTLIPGKLKCSIFHVKTKKIHDPREPKYKTCSQAIIIWNLMNSVGTSESGSVYRICELYNKKKKYKTRKSGLMLMNKLTNRKVQVKKSKKSIYSALVQYQSQFQSLTFLYLREVALKRPPLLYLLLKKRYINKHYPSCTPVRKNGHYVSTCKKIIVDAKRLLIKKHDTPTAEPSFKEGIKGRYVWPGDVYKNHRLAARSLAATILNKRDNRCVQLVPSGMQHLLAALLLLMYLL